jgi:hypothetical protein
MKKIIFASLIGFACITAIASSASAGHTIGHTKYCRDYAMDPICMSPEMFKLRAKMMRMTKAKALENRSRYCRNATYGDLICTKETMKSTRGY